MPEIENENEKELSKHKFSYDIQRKQYVEGDEKFNTEMKEDGYVFQFDRLYTIHDQDLKTYKFKAKLTEETLAKESDEDSEVTSTSDEQNAPFVWSSLDNEIWHIDTTIADYNAMVASLWQNVYDETTGERLGEQEEEAVNRERGIQYYEAMDIILNDEEHHLPEDWNGKDKIYFITDMNPELNLDEDKSYPQVPEGADGIIETAIQTIVQGLETLVTLEVDYDDVVASGINPEDYGFEKSAGGRLIKS